jgi:hypothetical protein
LIYMFPKNNLFPKYMLDENIFLTW